MKKITISLLLLFTLQIDTKINYDLEKAPIQRYNWMYFCDFAYQNQHDCTNGFRNETPFNPKDVQPGSTIFITGYGIQDFFKNVNPYIKHPYILVCLFAGGATRKEYLDDPNVIALFSTEQYGCQLHPKFHLIPLGIWRDKDLFIHRDHTHKQLTSFKQKKKTKLLYVNFSLHEWATWRHELVALFKNKPFATHSPRKPFMTYMNEMADHRFALSPRGDQFDCYRHWEAILVGTIPIIQPSYWEHEGKIYRDKLFDLLEDLPVLFIDDWTQITEEFLNKKYEEIMSKKYDLSKLYMKYWADQIDTVKHAYLQGKLYD